MDTTAPRSKFNAFRARRLENSAIRAAYKDAKARSHLIDALVQQRNALGLKQTQVAKAMGVGQSTVCGFETEGADPRLSTVQRYARAVDAAIRVQVVPKGRSVELYSAGEIASTYEAARLDTTYRATTWARTGRRYSSPLSAVA